MRCDEFKDLLPQFLDGRLSCELNETFTSHAQRCPACNAELETHRNVINRLKCHAPVAFPAGLHVKIIGTIDQAVKKTDPAQGQAQPYGPLVYISAGVVAAVALVSILFLGSLRPGKNSTAESSESSEIASSTYRPTQSNQTESSLLSISPSAIGTGNHLIVSAFNSPVVCKSGARFVCSGKDDDVVIVSAFQALGRTGGNIILEPGNYICSGMLSIPENTCLCGRSSDDTTLEFHSEGNEYSIILAKPGSGLANLTISGQAILIRGDRATFENITRKPRAVSGTGMKIITGFEASAVEKPLHDVKFINCSVHDCTGSGFVFTGRSREITFKNIELSDCKTSRCGLNNNGAGYEVRTGNDIHFESCSDNGSSHGWIISNHSSRIRLNNCRSNQNRRRALWISDSRALFIKSFVQTAASEIEGYLSLNGIPDKNDTISSPVSESEIEITTQATGTVLPINLDGSNNSFRLYPGNGNENVLGGDR